ncbi:hypothetical protein OIU76_006743 [Salix suchowensis]|nr:hypothetical protein OIU76_006743 [Salix suchowensis]
MRGIATHTQAMHAQSSVAVGLKGANKAMETMNKQMAPEKQMKVIREFQKQSAQMDMTVRPWMKLVLMFPHRLVCQQHQKVKLLGRTERVPAALALTS